MASIRQEKIASLIKRELAIIFQRESSTLFNGRFITVTHVRMTPDLNLAKVYLSFMAVKDKQAELDMVKTQTGKIKHSLGQNAGKQLRKLPDLAFYIDDSLDYYEKIDDLLKK
ncbi:MAG: 30S ribosome-binding factor RbfA [Flavobacteriales bacterium]|nr:30S ribosome-binding factor RbfA [Flavobacteriales bacterium]